MSPEQLAEQEYKVRGELSKALMHLANAYHEAPTQDNEHDIDAAIEAVNYALDRAR